MEKEFKKIDIDSIPQSELDAGKEWLNYAWTLQSLDDASAHARMNQQIYRTMFG